MNETGQYVVNRDYCPKQDNILLRDQCKGCKHYQGFELYFEQPSVLCSFYADAEKVKE